MEECTSTVSAAAVGLSIGFGEAVQSMAGKKVGIFFGYPETKNRLEWRIIRMKVMMVYGLFRFVRFPFAFLSMNSHLKRSLDSSPYSISLSTYLSFLHNHLLPIYPNSKLSFVI